MYNMDMHYLNLDKREKKKEKKEIKRSWDFSFHKGAGADSGLLRVKGQKTIERAPVCRKGTCFFPLVGTLQVYLVLSTIQASFLFADGGIEHSSSRVSNMRKCTFPNLRSSHWSTASCTVAMTSSQLFQGYMKCWIHSSIASDSGALLICFTWTLLLFCHLRLLSRGPLLQWRSRLIPPLLLLYMPPIFTTWFPLGMMMHNTLMAVLKRDFIYKPSRFQQLHKHSCCLFFCWQRLASANCSAVSDSKDNKIMCSILYSRRAAERWPEIDCCLSD